MATDECIHLMERATCSVCTPRRGYDLREMYRRDAGAATGAIKGSPAYDWEALYEGAEKPDDEFAGLGPVFEATQFSPCNGCASDIKPGDPIHWDDELGGYACKGCDRRSRA